LSEGSGFGGTMEMPTHGETRDDDDKERQALEQGGEILNLAAHADALPLEKGKKNDDGDGGNFDFVEAVEDGEKMRQVLTDDDADSAGGATSREPVAPTDDEAREIADGTVGEIVLAAASGNGCAEFGELEGADKGVESTAEPNAKEEPMIGEARGDVAGSANNAGGDGVADRDGDAETDAENL